MHVFRNRFEFLLNTYQVDRYLNLFLNAYINRHVHAKYLKMIKFYSPFGINTSKLTYTFTGVILSPKFEDGFCLMNAIQDCHQNGCCLLILTYEHYNHLSPDFFQISYMHSKMAATCALWTLLFQIQVNVSYK